MPTYRLCPRCMLNYITGDEEYCVICKEELRGVRFDDEDDELYTKTCPRCGAPIPDDADYCENCRSEIEDKIGDEDEDWEESEGEGESEDIGTDGEDSMDDDLPEDEGFDEEGFDEEGFDDEEEEEEEYTDEEEDEDALYGFDTNVDDVEDDEDDEGEDDEDDD